MAITLSQAIRDTASELREQAAAAKQHTTERETIVQNLLRMAARLEALPVRTGTAGDDEKASPVAPQVTQTPVAVSSGERAAAAAETPKTG